MLTQTVTPGSTHLVQLQRSCLSELTVMLPSASLPKMGITKVYVDRHGYLLQVARLMVRGMT